MTFSRQDTCDFIAEQAEELSKLAAAKGLDTLSYMLRVAMSEAENQKTAHVKRKKVA
ncbi:MAG: hypothetical protein HY244_17220 [Rhizobiales bacterium]|nr:hypothetical protein [Hyphomicrobiales bacterium]